MDKPAQENFPTVGPSPIFPSSSLNTDKKGRKGRERDETQFIPPGWKLELVLRQSGKTKGIYDKYWYSPEGKKFKSKVSVLRYLDENPSLPCTLEHKPNEEDGTIFFRNAGINLGKRKHYDPSSHSIPCPELHREKKKIAFPENSGPDSEKSDPISGNSGPISGNSDPISGNSDPISGNSVLFAGDTMPIQKEEEWEVEAILDSRFNATLGATQYCTLWVDGSVTWEPAKNFVDENGSQNTLFLEFIQSCELSETPKKSKNGNQKRKKYGYYGKDIVDAYTVEDEDYDPENDEVAHDNPEILCPIKENHPPRNKSHKRKSYRKAKSRGITRNTEKCPKKEPSPELRNHHSGSFHESFQNSFDIPVLETISYPDDEVLSENSPFQIVESVDNSDTSEPRWETDDWDVLPTLEHIDRLF